MTLSFVIPEFNINGAGTPPLQFFRRGFNLNVLGGSQPSWKDIIIKGNTALTLVNAKADSLNYLKLFGGTEQLPETYIDSVTLEGKCEQNGTPIPTVPVDIVCNNGAIKYGYATVNLNVGTLDNQGYTSTGGESSSSTFCGTLWKIKVSEGEVYTISFGGFPDGVSGVFVNTWKTDSTFNTRQAIAVPQQGYWTYTIPQGVGEVNFTLYKTGGITIDSNSWMQVELGSTPTSYVPAYYGIYTNGTKEVVTDNVGNTATAQMLLSVGDYKDTQEVLTGAVTRNTGVKVFDGSENFSTSNATFTYAVSGRVTSKTPLICSHFEYSTKTSSQVEDLKIISFSSTNIGFRYDACADTTEFKAWLKSQYDNGTPVIVVYPKDSATTETVTSQVLQKEPVTVTGSLTGLVANTVSSTHTTPTPTQPLQINTNNGVLTFGVNTTYNTADGQGTFVTPSELTTTRIYKAFGKLKAGKYKVKITGNFEFIFQYKDTNDITPTNYGNIGTWATEDVYEITDTSLYYGVAIRNSSGSGSISPSNFNNIGSIGYSYLDVIPVGTTETVQVHSQNIFNKNDTENIGGWYSGSNQTITQANANETLVMRAKPNTTYYFKHCSVKGGCRAFYTEVEDWEIGSACSTMSGNAGANANAVYSITTSANAKWIFFNCGRNNVEASFDDQRNDFMVSTSELTSDTPYEPYFNGGTATAEMLLKVGDYQDVQEVLTGNITRNIGIKVIDGTETWTYTNNAIYAGLVASGIPPALRAGFCTHFNIGTGEIIAQMNNNEFIYNCTNYSTGVATNGNISFKSTMFTDLATAKQFLADQYNSGNPVVVVYPLAESTTESVTAQPLTIQAGTNIVEITQASMDNLELEVSYKAGVEVTVTEIENAQLDNSVEVTVNG